MSITKEKNGTYTIRYRITDPITGKKQEKKKRGFTKKSDAVLFEKSLSRKGSDVLFYTLFKEQISLKDCNDETRTDADHLIRNHIPTLLTVKYQDLTKPFMLELRQYISNLDLSPRRKNKIIDTIKGTCQYADEVYGLENNSSVLKRFKIQRYDIEIWSVEEYMSFEKCVQDYRPEFAPFFHLLYFTGLRKGEARALQIQDLDIDNAYISVTKAMRRGQSSLGATKNPQSVRKVKLDQLTVQMLTPLKSNEKWLFGDWKPFSNSAIQRVFDKCTESAGLHSIRIHDLRHSHCSYLLGNGIDPVSASARLGHSSITTTLNTYSHVLKNAEDKVVNLINVSTLCPADKEKPLK